MTTVSIRLTDDVIARFGAQLAALGDGGAKTAMRRASMHTGAKARTQVARALVAQTGLKYGTMRRAVKLHPSDGLGFTLETRGGNVALKYFSPREAGGGVSAKPWNRRAIRGGAFIKSGWRGKRRLVLGGHVFKRVGGSRLPISRQKSGLFIPIEMLQGAAVDAFNTVVQRDMLPRLAHEIGRMLPR